MSEIDIRQKLKEDEWFPDVGMFRKARPHETQSQYERAMQIQQQFAHCMTRALRHRDCDMPSLCAHGNEVLLCAHLRVDYANFTQRVDGQGGIPLTGRARKTIDARLRAIGTLVYRDEYDFFAPGSLPGDIYVPQLQRINSFTGTRKTSGAQASARTPAGKDGGLLGRLLGIFD